MKLTSSWETWLDQYINFNQFYEDLNTFIGQFEIIIPKPDLIFNVFEHHPKKEY